MSLDPEWQFLRACALGFRLPEITELNWEKLWLRAQFHRLLPSLARNCLKQASQLPPRLLELMGQVQRLHGSRCALQLSDIKELHQALQARGVAGLFYKGVVLSAAVYAGPMDRHSGDIDLLVMPEQIHAALAVLAELGYQHRLPPLEEARVLRAHLRTGHELPLIRHDRDYTLDVHWHLQPHYLPGAKAQLVWQRSRRWNLGGAQIPVLSDEDQALVLSQHACKSGWEQMRSAVDLLRCLERLHDLEGVREEARAQGCGRMFEVGLLMVASLQANLTSDWMACRRRSKGWRNCRFVLSHLDSWWARVRYLLGRVFTPTESDHAQASPRLSRLWTLLS